MTEPLAIIQAMEPITDRQSLNEDTFFENLRLFKDPQTNRESAPDLNFNVKTKNDSRMSVKRKLEAA